MEWSRYRVPAALFGITLLVVLAASAPAPAGTYTFGTKLTLTQVRPSKNPEGPKTDPAGMSLYMRNTLLAKFKPRYNTFTKISEQSFVVPQFEEVEFPLENGEVFCVMVQGQKPSTKGVILRLRNVDKFRMIELRSGDYYISEVEKGDKGDQGAKPLIILLSFELLQANR